MQGPGLGLAEPDGSPDTGLLSESLVRPSFQLSRNSSRCRADPSVPGSWAPLGGCEPHARKVTIFNAFQL